MLTTQSLKFKYPEGDAFEFPDIYCPAQEKLLILGSSGVGKSTLLHLLGGLINTPTGSVLIDDQDMMQMSNAKLDKFRGENIGIVFQKNHFIRSISVLENLLIAQFFAGQKEDESKCKKILDRLNILDKQGKAIKTLSEGEKQRVAIARAVVNAPKVILADEPTSALDDNNCSEVISLLEEHAHTAKAALVIVTHDSRLKEIISNQIVLTSPIFEK
ncbi:MAG: ATP-binding cassette domain-containing protein [Saprospiraceae bacterium]